MVTAEFSEAIINPLSSFDDCVESGAAGSASATTIPDRGSVRGGSGAGARAKTPVKKLQLDFDDVRAGAVEYNAAPTALRFVCSAPS